MTEYKRIFFCGFNFVIVYYNKLYRILDSNINILIYNILDNRRKLFASKYIFLGHFLYF